MTAPWNTIAPIKHYLRRAQAAGIDKTIVIPPFHSDYDEANAELGRLVARYPNRLAGFAFVHARRDAGRIFEMVRRALNKWGFRSIKVHGFDAMPTREVCEAARVFRLPMLVDVVSRPEVVDMLAPQYPDVNFIIPHLGSFTDDWIAHQQVIYQIARYPNVYADTSAVRQFDYLVQAIKRAGPRKLYLARMDPGPIPAWNFTRYAYWVYHPISRQWFWAEMRCGYCTALGFVRRQKSRELNGPHSTRHRSLRQSPLARTTTSRPYQSRNTTSESSSRTGPNSQRPNLALVKGLRHSRGGC